MVGRKIRKAYRGRQVPHGKQSVRKLMAHGTATNSIELSGDAKSFDRVARKWNVDYAFYKTGPDKYLILVYLIFIKDVMVRVSGVGGLN